MKLHGTMAINEKGHLTIGGCDTTALAEEFGTPLYIIDEELLRSTCRAFHKAYIEGYPGAEVVYASKAFMTMAMARIIAQEDLGIDAVSQGELYTALKAGVDPSRIIFHGNNKSQAELRYALENQISRFIVDNLHELEVLDQLAGSMGMCPKILFRIQPGIEAHTHEYIQTGKIDSKFGLSIATGQAMEAAKAALQKEHVELVGMHCHIGSQIFEIESFRQASRIMAHFLKEVQRETGKILEELNMGGGFGIYYREGDSPAPVSDFAEMTFETLAEEFRFLDFPMPKRLTVEPGRSIIGPAGSTLYTVGSVKTIPCVRTYVAIDGGMADNPRPALYQAKYEMALANKMDVPNQIVASVTGKCCESGDMLIWDASMPWVQPGDLLLVSCTGAYNYSMSSNYNRLLKPAVVLVKDGKADVIVKRETFEDLVRNDIIPDRLK